MRSTAALSPPIEQEVAERADLPDVDVPVRRLRRLRGDDRVPPARATRTRAATATPPWRRSRRRWPLSRGRSPRSASRAAWRRSTPSSPRSSDSGDRIVAGSELYGGAYSLFTDVLPRFGVDGRPGRSTRPDAVAAALPGASLLYLETIANPATSVADLAALGALAAEAGVPAAVDNTFASPYLCTPAAFGFAYVIHSATKYLGGHHDLIGGVVCCSAPRIGRGCARRSIDTGGTMAPFEAWLAMRGHHDAAAPDGSSRRERADGSRTFLEAHPKVATRALPGSAFASQTRGRAADPAAAPAACWRSRSRATSRPACGVCDALELAWVATSLGGTHTLVGHAASTTHRQMDPEARRAAGIADGLIRVSVGLEDVEDLDRGLRPCPGEGVTPPAGRGPVRRAVRRARDLVHLRAIGDRRAGPRADRGDPDRDHQGGPLAPAAGSAAAPGGVRPHAGGHRRRRRRGRARRRG